MTTRNDPKPRNKSSKTLTWTATEPAGLRRWWIFVLIAYFAPLLAIICLAYNNWSAALLLAAFTLVYFVVYLPRPRVWNYELTGEVLTVKRANYRGPADSRAVRLDRVRDIELHEQRSRHSIQQVLTLLPKLRFGLDIDVYLPDGAQADAVLDRFLAYGETGHPPQPKKAS